MLKRPRSVRRKTCRCTFICIWEYMPRVKLISPRTKWPPFRRRLFRIYFHESCIFIRISLKFVPKVPNDNKSALVQVMAWRRPGDKPLSELMLVSLPTYIYATWPQWVNFLISWSRNLLGVSLQFLYCDVSKQIFSPGNESILGKYSHRIVSSYVEVKEAMKQAT